MHVILNVSTNAGKWEDESLRRIDAHFSSLGSTEIRLNWDGIEMDDPDHFTDAGSDVFRKRLVKTVLPYVTTPTLYILTDSTIDHNNYSDEGNCHNRASTQLTTLFRSHGICASVDAIRGSGFVARAYANEHFRPRLIAHLANTPSSTTVLFMGGWNDITSHHPVDRILNSISSCVSIATSRPKVRSAAP
jgi:hypothetical protein